MTAQDVRISPRTNGYAPAMSASSASPDSTEGRIILAALSLFAERGIDAVSLRSIMSAAGTNIASIHYHFGSKEVLVRQAILTRSEQICIRRSQLLDELDASGDVTARTLARAFITPIAEMTASDDAGAAWVRLISTIMTTGHPSMTIVTDAFLPQWRRFSTLLRQIQPAWPIDTVLFRLSQAMRMTFMVLGDAPTVQAHFAGDVKPLTSDARIRELEDLLTAMLGPAVV